MPKKNSKIGRTFILVIPILFYNVLTDSSAIGWGSIVFLLIPIIITIGLGIFILCMFIKRLRRKR